MNKSKKDQCVPFDSFQVFFQDLSELKKAKLLYAVLKSFAILHFSLWNLNTFKNLECESLWFGIRIGFKNRILDPLPLHGIRITYGSNFELSFL